MIKKIQYIFTSKQKKQLIGISLMNFFAAVFELLGVSAIFPLISVVLTPETIKENDKYRLVCEVFNIHSANEFILFISLVLIVLYVVKNLYLMLVFYVFIRFNYSANRDVTMRLMTCYLNQEYLFHVKNSVSKLQRNVSSDVKSFFNVVTGYVSLSIEVLTSLFIFLYLLWVDLYTTLLITILLGVLGTVIIKIYKNKQVKAGEVVRKTSAEQNKWFLQAFGGIKEIKVLNREKFFLDNYKGAINRNIVTNIRINMLTKIPKYVIEMVMMSTLLGVICIRVLMGTDLKAFATSLSAFAVAAIRLLPSFNRITEYASSVFQGKTAVDNIYKDLKEIDELSSEDVFNKALSMAFDDEIRLENISFRYPENEKMIFENESLTIKKNHSVAFIGESGAGKTTLVDIILGLLKPTKGTITVDGQNIFNDLNAWHKTVGYIPQYIYLMDDTIKNNIVFGATDNINEERLREAIKMACLDKFVDELEMGIDTQIGDRGVRLSGGQRQRIGIARALYANPKILVLDEATSALDNETEKMIMESIDNLHGQMTLLIIAHRLTTIKNCDSIYEVKKGKIELKTSEEVFDESKK